MSRPPCVTKNSEYLLRYILIGDSCVGKSALLHRLCSQSFKTNINATIGVDCGCHTITVDGATVRLQLWDTPGHEKFRTISSAYYRRAHGIMIVYDVTWRESFENVKAWIRTTQSHADSGVVRWLVGSKTELRTPEMVGKKTCVSTEEGSALASRLGIPFIEVSAKSGDNVEQAFVGLARTILFPQSQLSRSPSEESADVCRTSIQAFTDSELVAFLQSELQAARNEIANLKAQVQSLREELRNGVLPPGSILIRLPFCSIPPLSFPQKWTVSKQRLAEGKGALALHQSNITSIPHILEEYKNVFSPFLDEKLPRRILSASATLPERNVYECMAIQVSKFIAPGDLFSKEAGIPLLSRKRCLRQDAKILDSAVMKHTDAIFRKNIPASSCLLSNPHPSYSSAFFVANSHDPLMSEAGHVAVGRLRRSLQTSKLISCVDKVGGLDKPINLLQRIRKLRHLEFSGESDENDAIPWVDWGASLHDEEDV